MSAVGKKKKGKKGLIIGLVLVVLFASAGAVVGLAMAGKINIPGLTPKKKPTAAPAAVKEKPKPKVQPKKEEETPPVDDTPKPTTKIVDKAGAEKLAEVWNEMDSGKLVKVVAKWKPDDLASIFNEMDPGKVAEVMALMEPPTAMKVSQALKQVASQVPIEAQ